MDLDHGRQSVSNDDQRSYVALNGELYNHAALHGQRPSSRRAAAGSAKSRGHRHVSDDGLGAIAGGRVKTVLTGEGADELLVG